jgi:hypothetical protein
MDIRVVMGDGGWFSHGWHNDHDIISFKKSLASSVGGVWA